MMNKIPGRGAWLVFASLVGSHGAWSVEPKGAPWPPARPASSSSAESGTVSKIDARGSTIELDGRRRFSFTPASVIVRRQSNQGGPAGLSDLGAGTKVSLTVIKASHSASSAEVAEIWIAP